MLIRVDTYGYAPVPKRLQLRKVRNEHVHHLPALHDE